MRASTPIFASRPERFFAYLIDTIILILPGALLIALFKGSEFAILFTFGCNLAYYMYFTASSWQATPGKRLLGIYVMRMDRTKLTTRDALERFLAFVLPSLPVYTSFISEQIAMMLVFWLTLLWFAPILFTDERVGYHDRLCKTRVVVGKADA